MTTSAVTTFTRYPSPHPSMLTPRPPHPLRDGDCASKKYNSRHRLNGYLDQWVPSLFLAGSSGNCSHHAVLKRMFTLTFVIIIISIIIFLLILLLIIMIIIMMILIMITCLFVCLLLKSPEVPVELGTHYGQFS